MNVNDLTTAQLKTIVEFREGFPDVVIWPSERFGVVLLRTISAGIERVSYLSRDGSTAPETAAQEEEPHE
jgi:hypothetical protein